MLVQNNLVPATCKQGTEYFSPSKARGSELVRIFLNFTVPVLLAFGNPYGLRWR
jgi:hypothetical protein